MNLNSELNKKGNLNKGVRKKSPLSKTIDKELFLAKAPKNRLDLPLKIANGLPNQWLEYVKDFFDYSDKELADLFNISLNTIRKHRMSPDELLNEYISERLYRIIYISYHATLVFNDEEEAVQWLKSPQYGLNENIPIDIIRTSPGTELVENLLGKIEYGIY